MRAKNYQLIELQKPAALNSQGDRLYFTDQPQLRTLNNRMIQITAISVYPAEAVPNSPSGNTVSPTTELAKAFLVINVSSIDKFLYLPMVELNPVIPNNAAYSAAMQEFFQLVTTTEVDWTKSYIQFGAAPAATAYSFLFGVRYYVLPADIMASNNKGVV